LLCAGRRPPCRIPHTTDYRLPITEYWVLVAGYWFTPFGRELVASLLGSGCWLLVYSLRSCARLARFWFPPNTEYRIPITDYRILVTGSWLLTTHSFLKSDIGNLLSDIICSAPAEGPLTAYPIPPITDYRLPNTGYWLLGTGLLPSVVSSSLRSSVLVPTEYRIPNTEYRLPITEYWLLVPGCSQPILF
jgi:hypothetical protein